MKNKTIVMAGLAIGLSAMSAGMFAAARAGNSSLGIFENHSDVGTVLHAGSAEFDRGKSVYTLTGSGENMWLGKDAFQFVWRKVSGDVAIAADISFQGEGGNAHRKAVLMIRQSLDADSVYVDVARHGNGLTSLQYRVEKGDITHQIVSHFWAPKRVRIEKHGDMYSMWVDADTDGLKQDAVTRVAMQEPFYVGIGVCSHDKDVVERAFFSNLQFDAK
ncbi:MAG TPA: hypothetical protein VJP87_00975 [Candidatus Acidoferrales bacterium]|nr:hypothetical protein [Candidatus Acidoferrales bacterium]